jgi:hypothetical protein
LVVGLFVKEREEDLLLGLITLTGRNRAGFSSLRLGGLPMDTADGVAVPSNTFAELLLQSAAALWTRSHARRLVGFPLVLATRLLACGFINFGFLEHAVTEVFTGNLYGSCSGFSNIIHVATKLLIDISELGVDGHEPLGAFDATGNVFQLLDLVDVDFFVFAFGHC